MVRKEKSGKSEATIGLWERSCINLSAVWSKMNRLKRNGGALDINESRLIKLVGE